MKNKAHGTKKSSSFPRGRKNPGGIGPNGLQSAARCGILGSETKGTQKGAAMTRRDRVKAAIRFKKPDFTPYVYSGK